MVEAPSSETREALNTRQFGEMAAAYVESATHAQGDDLAQIAALAAHLKDADVIDLGCGGGHVSYALAPLVGTVTAYDLSADMLAAVAAEAGRRGLGNLSTRQGAAESLPFADGRFDAVFSRYSAHHWPDIRRGLREARRVLKSGGIAVFADAVAPEQPGLDTFLQTFEMLRDPSHVRDYAVAEWIAMAAQADFAVTGITRRRLALQFDAWIARQRTAQTQVAAIRALFRAVPAEMRRHFDIQGNDDFAMDTAVIELATID
jgi:SAM-dependent methyltransferase